MLNELDPNYDPKGHKGGGGRAAAPKLADLIADGWNESPDEHCKRFAAFGLAMKPEDIPHFETIAEMQTWVFRMHSLRGSKEHFTELADRVSPKPSRLAGLNADDSTRTRNHSGQTSAQDQWFEGLEREAPLDEKPDDEDLM